MMLTRQRVATAVPQALEKRLEVMEAIRTLAVPEGEPLRRRRAEIASIRRELTEIALALEELRRACDPRLRSYVIKYSPDQPRVPAGNPDGGQWTSEGGDASSIDSASGPGGNADDAAKPGVQYAQLDSGTRTDASGSADDDPISSRDIPADDPKHPVPFLDSNGNPVTDDQGNPILRPADLPPEMFVREGLAFDFQDRFAAAQQIGIDAEIQLMFDLALQLANFKQGGPWDAERVQGQYVTDYHDYANIAIGLYMAAAGVSLDDALAIADAYAEFNSSFKGPKDEVYTHSSKVDVEDIRIGYALYNSGRISPGQ